ncbi:hypothetical protein RB620_05665 [Paenibacillus sp. LHD-117]|uniref:hypothetical protein n=1 Tax=Paenibacillus sp. LHD-117 TaxID=3071412 RepID=UPI0027E1FD0D|nr:hypothetical protein [Paenibacillus sp. LHD-117]MDQ6418924.1 hypothetical protein [Paenibacillus sp. LHD-117]
MKPFYRAAIERGVIFSLAAAFIAQQLTDSGLLLHVLGGLSFAAVLLLLPRLKGSMRWLAASFLIGGAALLIMQGADARQWFEAASMNATLVTLFVFAPLFGIPVRLPAYVEALRRFYEGSVRSGTALFAGTQLLTLIMGAFINVGSIPVVYHMAFAKPHSGRMSKLLANAMNRGFGGAILWSPYFAAMALVTSALALSWSSLLPYVIGLSLLGVFVSLAVDWKELRAREDGQEEDAGAALEQEEETVHRGDRRASFPAGLGVYLVLAIVVILLLEQAIDLPMVLIICMAAVLFPLLWCVSKGAMATYKQGLANHVSVTLPALQKEITLFLAAGFFSGSIGATGFGASVPAMLEHLPVPLWFAFSLFTVAIIVLTSLIGLHPIVPVTILATGIAPASVGVSPVYFGVLLLGSWSLSNPISPASAVNNLLAGLLRKPVFELAKPNYAFAAVMAVVLLLYLTVGLR